MASSSPLPGPRDGRLLLLHAADNVLVARGGIAADERILVEGDMIALPQALRLGHKIARQPIAAGEPITKYGLPIGYATTAIDPGAHVHLHNVRSGYTSSIALDADQGESNV
jgi:hypothetical protein